jgi:hypothetical protein
MEKPKDIQDPKYDGNDYHAVQNGLDRRLHGNEAIDQPKKDTHHDENFDQLNQGHGLDLSVARTNSSLRWNRAARYANLREPKREARPVKGFFGCKPTDAP